MTDLRTLAGDVAIMVARIVELEAEVSVMRKNLATRTEAVLRAEGLRATTQDQFDRAIDQRDRAVAENATLREALMPFAENGAPSSRQREPDTYTALIPIGLLRRARAALGVTP